MSSDHHHHSGGGGPSRYFKSGGGDYGTSGSKRYHSPSDSGARGSLGSGGGSYYDSKRSRSDAYSGGGSGSYHHTSSARYNDFGATSGGSYMGNRYNKLPSSSTYYDTSAKSSSKYVDDYGKGSSRSGGGGVMKSSVRRIPPPPQLSSSSKMKSSSYGSSRPPPLMKLTPVTSSSSGLGSSGRDGYGGSRLRTAPPEHHSASSYLYSSSSSSTFRKPEIKRPARPVGSVLRNPYGPISTNSSGVSSAFKRGTIRAAASVSSKIRRRGGPTSSYEDRKKRIESYSNSRRDFDRTQRTEKRKAAESKDKKDSDTKETGIENDDGKKEEVKLPDGEVGVVLDEVGGDSDSDDNAEKDQDGEDVAKGTEKGDDDNNDEAMDETAASGEQKDESGSKEGTPHHEHDHDHEHSRSKDRRRSGDRDSSPSSRALLKMYCKYCDVRHVTFREYSHHLRSFSHVRAMNNAVTNMRKQLSKIRTEQRDEQRRAEKEEKVELTDTTSYCRVCELNFRTDPKEHEANTIHNDIKTLIYQRCDICDIDFRIWKVYLYHMAALEHVKRVAMKELKDAEGKVDGVKGTNLTQEELGADLMEVRTVFFCNCCVRYLPIKGDVDEAKERHCMTLTHVKAVEEFRQREKKIAERQRIRMEREEREKERRMKAKLKEESKILESEETAEAPETEQNDGVSGEDGVEIKKEIGEEVVMDVVTEDVKAEATDPEHPEVPTADGEEEEGTEEQDVDDEDEIELHAGDDVPEDEENEPDDNDNGSAWNRRTRSAKLSN